MLNLPRLTSERSRYRFVSTMMEYAFQELSRLCDHEPELAADVVYSDCRDLVPVSTLAPDQERKELPEHYVTEKELRRLIRQYTHPDKLVRASAKDKLTLQDYFTDSHDAEYNELVYLFCMVVDITGNRNRIKPYMVDILAKYEFELGFKINELLNKWFADAAILYTQGKIAEAEKLFKSHLYSDDDCFD